jgi:hypothetical protein
VPEYTIAGVGTWVGVEMAVGAGVGEEAGVVIEAEPWAPLELW